MSSFSATHWGITALIVWFVWMMLNRNKSPKQKATQKFKKQQPPKQADAIEGSFWDVAEPKPSDVHIHLIYKDMQGLRTRRTVNVRGFGTNGGDVFSGKCLMRNAYRTFLYSRVEQSIDPETGEIIDDLPKWLLEAHKRTPAGEAEKLAFDNLDVLKILLYVAKADGRMTAAEIAVISTTASAITSTEIDIKATKAALNTLNTPSLSGYQLAIRNLITQNRTTAEKALIGAKAIVNTQKTAHDDEVAAIEYFESKLIAA